MSQSTRSTDFGPYPLQPMVSLESVVDSLPDAIFIKDRTGRYLMMNPAGAALFDKKPHEIVGLTDRDLFNPQMAQEIRDIDQRVMATGEPVVSERLLEYPVGRRIMHTIKSPYINEQGKLMGVTGISRDITRISRAERALQSIVEGTLCVTGEDFFEQLVQHLTQTFEVRYAFIGHGLDEPLTRARMLAMCDGGQLQPTFDYEIHDTPCEQLLDGKVQVYARDVCTWFPHDEMLIQMEACALIGAPLVGRNGKTIGHLGVIHDQPISDIETSRSILQVFAARAAAELERHLAIGKLRDSEMHNRLIVEHAPFSIQRMDADRLITSVNPAGVALADASQAEMLCGQSFLSQIDPADRDMAEKTLQKVFAGSRQDLECRSVHGRDLMCTFVPMADEECKVASVMAMTQDITDRKQADAALRDSEARFRGYFEMPLVGIVITSADGRLAEMNDKFCDMLGYRPEELTGKPWRDYTHPDDLAENLELMELVHSGEIEGFSLRKRYVCKDGSVLQTKISSRALRNTDESVAYFVTLIEDITEQVEVEKALEAGRQDAQNFQNRLTQLIEVGNQLAHVESMDELCHQAVELGRRELGFERIGWWFTADDDPMIPPQAHVDVFGQIQLNPDFQDAEYDNLVILRGSYGTDERGNTRDENSARLSMNLQDLTLIGNAPYRIDHDVDLVDDQGRVVSRGTRVWVEIHDRGKVIGYLGVDNLLHGKPITRADCELLSLYGSMLGHLSQRKHIEEALRQSEKHHRLAAESNRRLLVEVNHRVRNNLGGLISLISMVRSKAENVDQFAQTMNSRLTAMTRTHNLLAESGWDTVDLQKLIARVISSAHETAPVRIAVTIEGEPVRIEPRLSLPLVMSLVEMFNNSVKHGAHCSPNGQLIIRWKTFEREESTWVRLNWMESGGPAIEKVNEPSLGTELIEGFVNFELNGRCELNYPPAGANHIIEFCTTYGGN